MATSLLLPGYASIHSTSQCKEINDLTVILTTSSVTRAEVIDTRFEVCRKSSLIIHNSVR